MLPGIRRLRGKAILRRIPSRELHISPVIIPVLPGAAHTDQALHALPIRNREVRQPIVRVLQAGLQAVPTGQRLREVTGLPVHHGHPVQVTGLPVRQDLRVP